MPPIKSATPTPSAPAPADAAAAEPAKKKGGKKKAPAPAAAPASDSSPPVEAAAPTSIDRPIIYPVLRAELCVGDLALTEAQCKQALGWETEREYQTRAMAANPGTTAETYSYGEAFMLRDEEGNKVRCTNNLDNRPFDEAWSRSLAQVILNGQWAGALTISEPLQGIYSEHCEPVEIDGVVYNPGDPITVPAGTINGSSIVISRTGRVESGQHSMVACILAYQLWWKNRKAYPFWAEDPQGPRIETILVTGVSEDRRVLMSIDNCKPRSEADVFYTSEMFRSLLPSDRKECSRMLATCVDFFWKRTGAKGYKTHPEVVALVERHPKLLKCIEHLFQENRAVKRLGEIEQKKDGWYVLAGIRRTGPYPTKDEAEANNPVVGGRMISNLRLSPGQAAAMCYLMGCSSSDGDAYRNNSPPREKGLDWKLWDKAKEFWAKIGAGEELKEVRIALGKLIDSGSEDDPTSLGGRAQEKLAVLSKAWDIFKLGMPILPGDLALNYTKLRYNAASQTSSPIPDGGLELIDRADFGGIDIPERLKGEELGEAPKSAEELEAAKEEERRRHAQETLNKMAQLRAADKDKPLAPRAPVGPSAATAPVATPKK